MNFFWLFLMATYHTIKKAEKKISDKIIEVKHEKLEKWRKPYQKTSEPSLGNRVKSAFGNIKNAADSAFENSVGYVISKGQDHKTDRYVKKNPGTKKKIVYMMPGWKQNPGSQRRYATQLRKEGYLPRHLKGNHHLERKESAEKGFEQIGKFQKKTKLKNPHKRDDYFSGHSSGGDVGIYMAGDERIKKYGIREVQARAPAPYGIKAKTWPQRLLIPFASKDDLEGKVAKRDAVEMAERKPKINIHIVAGKYDRLVTPKDTIYMPKHPKIRHYVIKDKNSTHIGTTGIRKDMNSIFIDLLKKGKDKYLKRPYKMAA